MAEPQTEGEIALDLNGRKHIDMTNHREGVYAINNAGKSLHVWFPDPGQQSADVLRDSLRAHVPRDLITDEYGDVERIECIFGGHLASLQAKLWRDLPRHLGSAIAKNRSDPRGPRPSAEEMNIALHVKFIAEQLDLERIFILHIGSKYRCRNAFCLRHEEDYTRHSSVVTIEPLIHWATFKPMLGGSISSGKIRMFTRSGEKLDDLLWTQAVRRFTPTDLEAYCLECLEHFMSMGVEAWTLLDGLQGHSTVSSPAIIMTPYETLLQSPGAIQTENDLSSARKNVESKYGVPNEGASSPSDSISSDESFDSSDVLSLQLDGVGDPKPRRTRFADRRLRMSRMRIGDSVWERKSRRTEMSAMNTNDPQSSLEEIHQSNHTCGIESSDDVAEKRSTDQFTWFTPGCIPSASQIPSSEKRFATPKYINYLSPAVPSYHNQRELGVAAHDHMFHDQTKPLEARYSLPVRRKPRKRAYTAMVMPTSFYRTLAPAPMSSPLRPLFAKRNTTEAIKRPNSVTPEAWAAYLAWIPDTNHRICSCSKPADTYSMKIAQCARNQCAIVWHHYECLDKSEKLKANHGSMICKQCRSEIEIFRQNRKLKWSINQVPASARYFPISRADVLGMPGIGGCSGTANPYGLGVETPEPQDDLQTPSSFPSALGSLAHFGYEESRPYLLTKAYTNPDALAAMDTDSTSDEYGEEEVEQDDISFTEAHHDPTGSYDGPCDEHEQGDNQAKIDNLEVGVS